MQCASPRMRRVLSCFLLWCVSLSLSFRSSAANIKFGNQTDRLALLAFKSQIQDPFNFTSSWNDSRYFCEWEGITCGRKHQRVTVLNLGSKGLLGPISPHIGNLSFLRTLILRDNSFHGEIPQELSHLFRLEDLRLDNNSLVGNIPANISSCSKLVTLFLSYNNFIGNIPIEFGSLSKLVLLALHMNRLTGGIPPFLGNLTSLETLSLATNNLGGSIPSTLDQLKNLKNIALSECKLSGLFPPSLYNHSAFEIISIPVNEISGTLPTEIGLMLPKLELFLIAKNQFSGPLPTSLFNVSRLQKIDVGSNQFSGRVPSNMGNLKALTGLYLSTNHLGSGKPGDLNFFTSLTNCSNLQDFRIDTNAFGGTLPTSIANFSNELLHFYASYNQISGNIPTEVGNLKSLIHMDLSCNFFTGSIPMAVGNLQNLGRLNLSINHLSGYIPSSIRNMSKLFSLDFSSNNLEGGVGSGLDNQNLQELYLSYNNFTGSIPNREIGLSSHLVELSLEHNSLTGSIPLEVGNLKSLRYLSLSDNIMSGEIPTTLASCLSLEYLYFDHNFFQGPLPSSLTSLKGLQILDVSHNNIYGKFPKELEILSGLRYLNLSFNNIEGEVPIEGIFQNASKFSVVGNHKICGGVPKLRLHKCQDHKSKKQGIGLAFKVALGVSIPFLMVLLSLVLYLRKRSKAKPQSQKNPTGLRRVSYNDLHKATDGFSSVNLIGIGSYGSVYKGILCQDEGHVAVKVFNLKERGASKSFLSECEALKEVRHRNLLKILTVCSSVDFIGNDFKALVFEFMPNGNLESWLHQSIDEHHLPRNLNLYQRMNIAIDVASALDYLHNHCEKPIIHCDMKSSNVLLGDDMTAHVGDFGLAKFISKGTSNSNNSETNSLAVRGTIGYIPPEYGMGAEVSTQGDIYSYGILLLEMFTGKRPTDEMFKDGLSLHDFSKRALPQGVMEIIDMRLLMDEIGNEVADSTNRLRECLSSIIRIGVACSVDLLADRIDVKIVLKEMNSIKEFFLQV